MGRWISEFHVTVVHFEMNKSAFNAIGCICSFNIELGLRHNCHLFARYSADTKRYCNHNLEVMNEENSTRIELADLIVMIALSSNNVHKPYTFFSVEGCFP